MYGFKLVLSTSEIFIRLLLLLTSLPSTLFILLEESNSSANDATVGVVCGSHSSTFDGSIGTQTRPVFGCTHQGDFSKWFLCVLTLTSKRG